jgi:hypothetical protein
MEDIRAERPHSSKLVIVGETFEEKPARTGKTRDKEETKLRAKGIWFSSKET